jgi:hypothetical protein
MASSTNWGSTNWGSTNCGCTDLNKRVDAPEAFLEVGKEPLGFVTLDFTMLDGTATLEPRRGAVRLKKRDSRGNLVFFSF